LMQKKQGEDVFSASPPCILADFFYLYGTKTFAKNAIFANPS
jgi:hypothetical protein